MDESSISNNDLVHGYGNHYIYGGDYMEDYQMGEHFWNFLTKEESKGTYNNEEGDVKGGIDAYFHNDFKDITICEEAKIKVCIDNDFRCNDSNVMVADAETDEDEVEGYIDTRLYIEEFQDMTADHSRVDVPDDSYMEVPCGKPTYYSHAVYKTHPDNQEEVHEKEFHRATIKGDLESMKEVMKKIGTNDHENFTMKKFHNNGTALHHTLWYGQDRVEIAEWLVKMMKKVELEMLDGDGYTPLSLAVLLHHDRDMLECIIDKNEDLLEIGASDKIPVVVASSKGFMDTTEFLYSKTPKKILSPSKQNPYDPEDEDTPGRVGIKLINQCITLNLFDIAGKILLESQKNAEFLRKYDDQLIYPTHALAKSIAALQISNIQNKKPSGCWKHMLSNFGDGIMNCCLGDWKPSSDDQSSHICEAYKLLQLIIHIEDFDIDINNSKYIVGAMMEAAEHGIVEFIIEILKVDRELIGINKDGKNIFWYAIMNRQEKVFNLIYGLDRKKDMMLSFNLKDEENLVTPMQKESKENKSVKTKKKEEKEVENESKDSDDRGKQVKKDDIPNILHFTAKIPSSSILDRISGPALQMQREVQWFEAVKEVTIHRYGRDLNGSGKTPYALFIDEHRTLLEEGEKSMKKTALAASTVSGLIVTTMFAAALAVVGSIYQAQTSGTNGVNVFFKVFLIFAALSLCSCTASIIVFLGILASRYSPQDFLFSLPRKFMIGFWALFAAIATMMFSFCFALYTMLKTQKLGSYMIAISVFSLVPILSFFVYLCPLLCKICRSTCKTVFDKSTRLPPAKKKKCCGWC